MLLAKWTPQMLDTELSEVAQDATSCTQALNFLFERGVARTRPHARRRFSEWNTGAKVDFAKSFLLNQGNRYTLYIDGAGAVRRLASTDSATSHNAAEITGAGTTFGDRLYHNIAVWAGLVLIGNNTGGLLVHTPLSSTTYSVVSDAKYRYVTTSFNRAIGAYDITSGSNNPREIGWSTTTDVTDWTGTGAGSTELTDIPDDITGLVNMNNVVVVARSMGWTLGYVTGSNTTGPFRWQLMVRDGSGCAWPSTLATYNNVIYCVGHDDVYTFDISRGPSPIGGPIREPLMRSISNGARYRGFITRGDFVYEPLTNRTFLPRLRYHLVPIETTEGARHYAFDVKDGRWSAHNYSTSIRDGFELVQDPQRHPIFSTSFVSDSTTPEWFQWWEGQVGASNLMAQQVAGWPVDLVDRDALLRSPTFLLNGSAERDYDIDRLMVVWAMEGDASPEIKDFPLVKLVATLQQDYKQVEHEQSLDLASKIDARKGEWNRSFFNLRLCGNLLRLQLTVPAGIKLAIRQIEIHGKDSAVARAA